LLKLSTLAPALVASTLVVGVSVTGCGSDKSSTPSSTTSSTAPSTSSSSASSSSAAPSSSSAAAQPTDYSNLLIKSTDIVVPGETFTPLNPPSPETPAGVEVTFANPPNASRLVKDHIYVYPDAAAATQARDMLAPVLTDPDMGVKGGTPTPVDVGTGGTMAIGTTTQPAGTKSKASIFFTEGKAFVTIDFESPANDPVPQDFVLDIARKQDAAIKAGLPA
jgi:hypothetical protein